MSLVPSSLRRYARNRFIYWVAQKQFEELRTRHLNWLVPLYLPLRARNPQLPCLCRTKAHDSARNEDYWVSSKTGEVTFELPYDLKLKDERQVNAQPTTHWEPVPPGATDFPTAIEHPEMPGLWMCKNIVPKQDLLAIEAVVKEVCRGLESESISPGELPAASALRWPWYQFDPARYVVPLLPHPGDGAVPCSEYHQLHDFEVFNNVHPDRWLSLGALASAEPGAFPAAGAAAVVAQGAEQLRRLQMAVPQALSSSRLSSELSCFFMQLQHLECGAQVTSHVDANSPRIDVIASLCVEGSNRVRVGGVTLDVEEGDVYVLEGEARFRVDHEVLPGKTDRLSITLRYAYDDATEVSADSALFQGKALGQDPQCVAKLAGVGERMLAGG